MERISPGMRGSIDLLLQLKPPEISVAKELRLHESPLICAQSVSCLLALHWLWALQSISSASSSGSQEFLITVV